MQNHADLYEYKNYSAIDFVIGILITVGASVINALGLNITKLDHTRQESLPTNLKRPDWKRWMWWLGLMLYIISQVVGSTLALNFLRAEYVAPIGSTSLIFNFIFAYLLVGTPVLRTDIIGTLIIVFGVSGTVVFGSIRRETDFDKESNLSLTLLKQIWGRSEWIGYFLGLQCATSIAIWGSRVVGEVCERRVGDDRGDAETEVRLGTGGRRAPLEEGWRGHLQSFREKHSWIRNKVKRALERWSMSRSENSIRRLAGLCWAITGGLLAGQTLVLAKSAVKLVSSAISKSDPNEANQFTSPLTWLIVILLVISSVLQIYCLNASLKYYDSTFTVPIFFATYTTCGFINNLVYLDEFKLYQTWTFVCIWISIGVLIIGVALLSLKKPQVRKRSASLEMDNGDVTASTKTEEKGKAQGWLGHWGIFNSSTASSATPKENAFELSQNQRRNQAGMQKLDDDSVFDFETQSRQAREVDMDEVDALDSPPVMRGSGNASRDNDFGEFKSSQT